MRLGFGVTLLAAAMRTGGLDGIASYTRELLRRLAMQPDIELQPYSFSDTLPPLTYVAPPTVQLARFVPGALLTALSGLPFPGDGAGLLRRSVDLVHATDHQIPYLGKTPVVATLMDAIPFSHPEWLRQNLRWAKTTLWRSAAQRAQHIITISDYSKQQIVQHFRIGEHKVSAIPLGVDERWFAAVEPQAMAAVMQRHGLPAQYFLCVGTLQPRKNLARVIAAHRALPDGVRSHVPLIIVGRAGWQCEQLVDELQRQAYGASVRWLQHLPDTDLLAVVKGASALVFASLGEGFGLPVLEAFAAGTPVIASNTTSVPEVAGDAALLVDPSDSSSIAAAMLRLVGDAALAGQLRERGVRRARAYTWDRTAAMTHAVYQQVLSA